MIDICEIFQVLMEPKQCCIYTVLEDNISRKYLLSLLAKHGIITTNNQELVKLKALITAEIGTLQLSHTISIRIVIFGERIQNHCYLNNKQHNIYMLYVIL